MPITLTAASCCLPLKEYFHICEPRAVSSRGSENNYSFAHGCKWKLRPSQLVLDLYDIHFCSGGVLGEHCCAIAQNSTWDCLAEFWLPASGWQSFLEAAVYSQSNKTWKCACKSPPQQEQHKSQQTAATHILFCLRKPPRFSEATCTRQGPLSCK